MTRFKHVCNMKKILKFTISLTLLLGGIIVSIFSVMQMIAGDWIWLIIFIAAGAVATAGFRIMVGGRLRDIIRDLLFVLMRTH